MPPLNIPYRVQGFRVSADAARSPAAHIATGENPPKSRCQKQKGEDGNGFFPSRPRKEISHVGSQKFLHTDRVLGMTVRTLRILTQPSKQPCEVATPILHTGKVSQRGNDLSEVTQLVRDRAQIPQV